MVPSIRSLGSRLRSCSCCPGLRSWARKSKGFRSLVMTDTCCLARMWSFVVPLSQSSVKWGHTEPPWSVALCSPACSASQNVCRAEQCWKREAISWPRHPWHCFWPLLFFFLPPTPPQCVAINLILTNRYLQGVLTSPNTFCWGYFSRGPPVWMWREVLINRGQNACWGHLNQCRVKRRYCVSRINFDSVDFAWTEQFHRPSYFWTNWMGCIDSDC